VFDLEVPYARRAGRVPANGQSINGPCILETLDACWGVCQVHVAQWLGLTAKRRSAT
jgi:hypothetical protein